MTLAEHSLLHARSVFIESVRLAEEQAASHIRPEIRGWLSADFSLLSQGIRSRKSGCRHLSASAEATRECELQGSALPSLVLKNRVREEALWLRAVS